MSQQKRKILITGVSGLLGSNLAYCLRDRYDVHGLYHTHELRIDKVPVLSCDLRDAEQIRDVIETIGPDVVIHCAAQADVEICEEHPDQAETMNVAATRNVIAALSSSPAKLIYISTDLVYGGTKGDNAEEDTDPQNVYGRTKLKGEEESLKRPGALVLRTNFFGWSIFKSRSLAEWIVQELRSQKQIKGFTDVITSTMYTFELAELTARAIEKDLAGVYNLGSADSLSKHDFAVVIADRLGFDKKLITPISVDNFDFKAKRSKNLSLNVGKLSRALGTDIPAIEVSLDRFVEDYKKGVRDLIRPNDHPRNVYPQLDYLSYGRQSIDEADIEEVVKVLKSSNLTQGPKIAAFEEEVCRLTGAKYAVAVNAGTSALHIACLAAGVKEGDEGITSVNTFVASANCIVYCGGRPVLGDIDPKTYNIQPEEIEHKINGRTKVVIPVHFAGQSCDTEAIQRIVRAKEKEYGHRIYLIEDAAHALGSLYRKTKVGSCAFSDMAIFSFHPVKHVTTGEGGMVLTNDPALFERLRSLRSHGIIGDEERFVYPVAEDGEKQGPWYYEQQFLGHNYRITDIQCALGLSQLKKLPAFMKRRKAIVAYYNQELGGLPWARTPFESPDGESNLHLYVLLIDFKKINKTRARCMEELREKRIRAQIHYIPVALQPFYRERFGTDINDYPNVKDYYGRCLSIPLYPGMTDEETQYVVKCIKELAS